MADTPTPPLNANSPIVDPVSGKPKPPFILLINQLLKSTVASASTIAQQALDAATAAKTAVTKLAKTKITAGVGLTGGGPISADVTIDMEDTAVTPGTYGDANNTPVIIVDQQGRITDLSTVPTSGSGGGGGGGGPVSARYWRIRALAGVAGHGGDGFGAMGVDWRDSGGASLIGAGTPMASRTDGSWNLAQAFDGDITSNGHGWYSGNGDGNIGDYCPWIGYDFLTPVTPATVEFAPLHGFSWTTPAQTAHEYSSDALIWQSVEVTENPAGTPGALQVYDIKPVGGGGGAPWSFKPPKIADFPTFINGMSGTNLIGSDDTDVGMILEWQGNQGNNDNSQGCFKALPAAVDWTVTYHGFIHGYAENYIYGGLSVGNVANDKSYTYAEVLFNAAVNSYFILGQHSNAGQSVNSNIQTAAAVPYHLKLSYNNATGDISIAVSGDGKTFRTVRVDNYATYLGAAPDIVGFKLHTSTGDSNHEHNPVLTVDRWEQSW